MPTCALCPDPLLDGEPVAHKDGKPYVHLRCLGLRHVNLDEHRTKMHDQHARSGAQRRGDRLGFAGGRCRLVPAKPAAP